MTDTKEMRAAFEVDFRERYSIPDTIPLSGCGGVECEWRGFQAAWTRKPAEQVAGSIPDSEMMLWDASDTEGIFGNGPDEFAETYANNGMAHGDISEVTVQCAHRLNDRKMRIEVTDDEENWLKWEWMDTHPTPEPVSVPVKWETRAQCGWPAIEFKYISAECKEAMKDAEIAEWRALAAERGWVK